MATNKNAVIRYLALDNCFRNSGKKYFIKDLLEACNEALSSIDPDAEGIKRRQLYEDIRFMEDEKGYQIDLEKKKDGKEVYYRYVDTNFSIRDRGLNESELNQIASALAVISRFKGMPQFEWIEAVTAKFESRFGMKKGAEKIIGFDENIYYSAAQFITPLFNAIFYKKVVKITYKNFKTEKEYDVIFHPYYLKEFNNRWFCFGNNENGNVITNLALDRIIRIKELKNKYVSNDTINFDEYFDDVIGVTVEGELEKVKLKVSSALWPYIKTKPIHGSQKIVKRENDGIVISIEVKLNYELQSLLLSHGEKIKVLEPVKFRNELLDRINKMR